MPRPPRPLEEPYRSRAVPAASARYFSWLFAAPAMRAPLLGIFALIAEWRALMDPAVELASAQLKLAWWQEEIERLSRGAPVHPIGCYLAGLPRSPGVDFKPLSAAIEAAARQIAGAPLEHGADIETHAAALWAAPLLTGIELAGGRSAGCEPAVRRSLAAVGAAQYLLAAIQDYRREARSGRVVFPVQELLAANVENADLAADAAPVHLQSYVEQLRRRALAYFAESARLLPRAQHAPLRHVLVLAALDARHLSGRRGAQRFPGLHDLYLAWSTARRAARRS